MRQYWLCYGKNDKWAAAVEHSRWGVKELAINNRLSTPAKDWEKVQEGDIAIFLIGNDKLCGWAVICGKTDQETTPLWPDEIKEGKVIYNRRLILDFLGKSTEVHDPISTTYVHAPNGAGLSLINEVQAQQAIGSMKNAWASDILLPSLV